MNKFIMLKSIELSGVRILWEGDYYLVNVSQIIWIHPDKARNPQGKIIPIVHIRFEDGSTLDVLNSKEEILEMMVLKPWWKNLIDAFRWLFIRKNKNP